MFRKLPEILASSLLLLFTCLLLNSCATDVIYEKTMDVPGDAWAYEDTLAFRFEIEDTTKLYGMDLEVRHAGDYSFQNLYVQFHTISPSGKSETQMVSLELAAQSGIWNGACSGNSCTVQIPLQAKAAFNETGEYMLKVEQFMRKNPLPGVQALTLKIRELQ